MINDSCLTMLTIYPQDDKNSSVSIDSLFFNEDAE